MRYEHIVVPSDGEPIEINEDKSLAVPERPIVPFIEGDGIGVDVTPVMRAVVDAAVANAYDGARAVAWMEVYAGAKAERSYGAGQSLPDETLAALERFVVSIKGPLATPVGGGLRSLNVAIRQKLDLYACVRPIHYFPGTLTTSKVSEHVDMVVFRENTEDIYAGIEWPTGSREVQKLIDFLQVGAQRHADSLPVELRNRHQARVARRLAAACSKGDRACRSLRPSFRYARPQGQHHEVHGGRVPELGLSAREGGIRRDGNRRRAVAHAFAIRAPAEKS